MLVFDHGTFKLYSNDQINRELHSAFSIWSMDSFIGSGAEPEPEVRVYVYVDLLHVVTGIWSIDCMSKNKIYPSKNLVSVLSVSPYFIELFLVSLSNFCYFPHHITMFTSAIRPALRTLLPAKQALKFQCARSISSTATRFAISGHTSWFFSP